MHKKTRQAVSFFSILLMMTALFIEPILSFAATVSYDKAADYVSTWHVKMLNGTHWTDEGVYMIKADGVPAFCIEHGTILHTGEGFSPSELTAAQKDRMALIAYYGYQLHPTIENYGITQNMIWQELGDELLFTNIPNFDQRKNEILAQVNQHNAKPSFNGQTIELKVGESITLNDTANNLNRYNNLLENSANLKIEKSENQLKLTATAESKETGTLRYGIANKDSVGQSFVYYKPGQQKVATFKLANAGEMNVHVKVNLNGNVKLRKVDEDTQLPVPNTKMKFEYNGQTQEVTTDENGEALLKDIQAGTVIKISEVTANNGYVNKGEVKEVTIVPNQTIEVVFGNKAQQGLLKLKKTGKQATAVTTEESDYGTLTHFTYEDIPLANVTFEIKATEEIKVGDFVHAKQGETVATVTTDENGELINMPRLYLGKYEAIETSAPQGFLVDSTPLPFEFTYEGQEVELVSQSLEVHNEFQKITVKVHKDEEIIKEWQENQPTIEHVPANEKVFGLFTNQEMTLTAGTTLAADALLAFDTIKDGGLSFADLQVPAGDYYVKELEAGENHVLDETHYAFSFSPEGDNETQTIDIYGNNDDAENPQPILNKLHFNHFSIKKINEEATLKEKEGFEFAYTGNGKGAIFTLSDEKEKVLQEVTVDDQSLATFNQIPVGTFYLKEKRTSADNYVLSPETYKIISTKDGVEAYDEAGKLVGTSVKDTQPLPLDSEKDEPTDTTEEEPDEEEPPLLLFEVKNDLVKGKAELTKKDVSTSQVLANTGIRILTNDKQVVVEGRTDQEGKFTFDQLPAGKYAFQEFDAPKGYQIDETPIPFEIKEDGEIVKSEMTNAAIPETPEQPNQPEVPHGKLPQMGEVASTLGMILGFVLLIGTAGFYIYRKKQTKENQSK